MKKAPHCQAKKLAFLVWRRGDTFVPFPMTPTDIGKRCLSGGLSVGFIPRAAIQLRAMVLERVSFPIVIARNIGGAFLREWLPRKAHTTRIVFLYGLYINSPCITLVAALSTRRWGEPFRSNTFSSEVRLGSHCPPLLALASYPLFVTCAATSSDSPEHEKPKGAPVLRIGSSSSQEGAVTNAGEQVCVARAYSPNHGHEKSNGVPVLRIGDSSS